MKHFFYNSILCYLVRPLCSAVRKFFHTNKRSGVAGHEEKKENSQSCIKYEPTASSPFDYIEVPELETTLRGRVTMQGSV